MSSVLTIDVLILIHIQTYTYTFLHISRKIFWKTEGQHTILKKLYFGILHLLSLYKYYAERGKNPQNPEHKYTSVFIYDNYDSHQTK